MRFNVMIGLIMNLAAVVAAGAIEAQATPSPRWFLDGTLVGAQPTGEFGLNVDEGWGFEVGGRFELDPAGVLSVRTSLGFINYGSETLRFCSIYSCRVGTELNTSNNILFVGIGPELGVRLGPLRPYARASLGIGYFETTSGLSGTDGWSPTYASTNNWNDLVFQQRLGAGLGIGLSNGRHPVWLDLGADYHHNGTATYLREGDIVDQPNGNIIIYPRRTEANLWSFRVGVSVGLGSDGDLGR